LFSLFFFVVVIISMLPSFVLLSDGMK